MQRSLFPLDSETRSKIRSTQILTSIPQIVSELVQNSLDANASHINIGVDVSEWECWVRDDGYGMSKKGMSILAKGPIEGRYGSSKAYQISSLDQVSTFGFRGEALASAADICCLEISSRTKSASESWAVIIKGGKTLHCGPAIRWRRETAGSVVSVRDAFYNLPVRRKTHTSPSKSLEAIRKDLQTFALVFPHVSFTLEDTSREPHLNQARGKILTISKTSSPLEAFRSAFGRPLVENVHMIRNQANGIVLEGFISLEGASSKAYQFLYINNRLLEPCDLHYVIDSAFARSTFGKNAFEDGLTAVRQTSRRSPRKNEKRPVYVLQLHLARDTVDSLLDPSKRSVYLSDMSRVQELIISSAEGFLIEHNFLSPVKDKELDEENAEKESGSPSKCQPAHPHSPTGDPPSPGSHRIYTESEISASLRPEDEGLTEWENPRTGEIFLINNRTGHSQLASGMQMALLREDFGVNKSSLSNEPPTSSVEQPDWIKGILTDWGNPVYKTGEQQIGTHETIELTTETSTEYQTSVTNQGKRSTIVFTATDLANAEVLGQVDRKFIACAIRRHSQEGDVLILVDQHAADERVRVERFLEEYCNGALTFGGTDADCDMVEGMELAHLEPRALVLLSKREADLLYTAEVRNHFRRWGIELEERQIPPPSDAGEDKRIQIGVSAVPKLIESKLLQGNELQDVLKSILGEVEMNGVPAWHSGDVDESVEGAPRWLRAWRTCPNSLLALVNSKACRGAIMFNDLLSVEQCSRLVLQLSRSAFPFQCAHGRPSIAPLVALDSLGELPLKRSTSTSVRASARKIDWLEFQPI